LIFYLNFSVFAECFLRDLIDDAYHVMNFLKEEEFREFVRRFTFLVLKSKDFMQSWI